jgi:D-sedoheptulose 7-phosphate isomerase
MTQTLRLDHRTILADAFSSHHAILAATEAAVADPFQALVRACATSARAGAKIILFGNGGSAADAQHLAAEFVVRLVGTRPPIAAIALTTDTSILTAAGNDFGFDQIFARQVEALVRPQDTVIAISTSGNSRNVVLAVEAARRHGCVIAGFTGEGGGALKDLVDPLIAVPSRTTARIQEMHILIGHALCAAVERELYG